MPQPLLLNFKRPPSPRTTKRATWAKCPVCNVSGVGAPISAACNGFDHHEPDGDLEPRLVCTLCGLGWHGTDEEVERSERKERAYQRQAVKEGR